VGGLSACGCEADPSGSIGWRIGTLPVIREAIGGCDDGSRKSIAL
jgi:hypothetical protein